MLAWLWRHWRGIFLWATTVGIVVFYARLIWETRRGVFITKRSPARAGKYSGHQPFVSIIVPARNEQRNIRRCVLSLLAQTYPHFEVIVVDDGSTDNTAAILGELLHSPYGAKLTIIHGAPLPPDWAGKPHALAQGVAAAKGEWLLFTDADTMHRPGALAWACQEGLPRDADLISLLTRQELLDAGNHIFFPIIEMGITAQYPPSALQDPRRNVAIANGQYLLIRRTIYDAVGGYAGPTLRASLLDDRDMALLVKRQGGHIMLLDGREQVSTCMYRSLPEALAGWSKNAYAGSRGGPLLFILFALALPIGTILPYLLLLVGLFSHKRALMLTGSLQVAAITAYRWQLDRQVEHARAWGWTHPIGAAIATGLLWRVAWRQFSGRGVTWSGRAYHVRQGLATPHPSFNGTEID